MEENKTTVTETKQEDKGLSQIQPNEKRSWWSIAFIWVGTMICIPMLMVGGIGSTGGNVLGAVLVTLLRQRADDELHLLGHPHRVCHLLHHDDPGRHCRL